MSIQSSNPLAQRYVRLLLVALAIAGCLLSVREALAYGASHVLTTFAYLSGNVAAANKATQLSPKDAESHFACAALLSAAGNGEQSVGEVDQAVALRPADYRLWWQLGLLRDQTGDSAGALRAFGEAIKRAPFYAQPRWDRGNALVRNRQYEAGFKDMSEAAQSNEELVPALLELAWGLSRGDVKLTEELAQIKTEKMRLAFAKLLAKKGRAQEAMAQFAAAGVVPEELKTELTDQLLAKGAFKEAFEIWKTAHPIPPASEASVPAIYDGGFEGTLAFGESGFAWKVPRELQTAVSLDSSQAQSGARSLRIDFSGTSDVHLTQLILVNPSSHYRINFAARSQDVVTGGLPYFAVNDAVTTDAKPLGQSTPLAKGTTVWQSYSVDFTTAPTTAAVVLSLRRESCSTSPCPIFGSIWLDSFSIEQSK